MKIMIVFGTRPEAIKMAPIIKATNRLDGVESVVVSTGQHGVMLDQVMKIFDIHPDKTLDAMHNGKTLNGTMSYLIKGIDEIIKDEHPDWVIVQGDTSTAAAGALAAYYDGIRIAHVEAGLRTWDKNDPYPEEANRQIIDVVTDVYFPPTPAAADNLTSCHVDDGKIFITGNTSIDALRITEDLNTDPDVLKGIPADHKVILMTMHRRETQGEKMDNVFKAIRSCVETHPDVDLVYPVHPNPAVSGPAHEILGGHERIHLTRPLDLLDMHEVMRRSYFIMTDSGGVQEEAPSLDVPVLVLRDDTERMEAVDTGALELVGVEPDKIMTAFDRLMTDDDLYRKMATAENPYGDGHAADRIISTIISIHGRN